VRPSRYWCRPGRRRRRPRDRRRLPGRGGWLDPATAADLLARVGITILPVVAAAAVHQAVAAAGRCGYPVTLKTAATDVVHKSDVSGVRLGIQGRHELSAAYETMTTAIGDPHVTVQPMAPEGVELVVGLNRDDLFGSVLMAGAGGVLTDLLADHRWRGLPLTDLDATEMLRSLRCAPAADQTAVLDVRHRIARLAELAPEVAELDVNPLVAAPGGAYAIDVRVRLSPAPDGTDPYTRRLR
jgi:ATP-grasp domain